MEEQTKTNQPSAEKPKTSRTKKEKTAETEKLRNELEKVNDEYRRMLAEYANYKRRTEQEKEQLGQFVRGEVLAKLLPCLDNLERAAEADAANAESYKKGVEMVLRQLRDLLGAEGMEEIPAAGMPFDPEQHQAVNREDADGVEPETVTEVYQKGYRLGNRVLRPAMVKVAN